MWIYNQKPLRQNPLGTDQILIGNLKSPAVPPTFHTHGHNFATTCSIKSSARVFHLRVGLGVGLMCSSRELETHAPLMNWTCVLKFTRAHLMCSTWELNSRVGLAWLSWGLGLCVPLGSYKHVILLENSILEVSLHMIYLACKISCQKSWIDHCSFPNQYDTYCKLANYRVYIKISTIINLCEWQYAQWNNQDVNTEFYHD